LIALPAHAALQHVTDTQHKAHRIESTGPSPPVRKSNRRPRSAIAVIPSRRGSVQPQAEIIFGSGLRSGWQHVTSSHGHRALTSPLQPAAVTFLATAL
jgi:hypothetical protein